MAESAMSEWRYELKLVCDGRWLSQARSWIRLHPAGLRVAYPSRQVNSLYFDTWGLANFTANTAGLSQREKVRLRWYGEGVTVIHPILERKQKSNMLGRKAQLVLPRELDLRWTLHDLEATLCAYVTPEWRGLLQTVHPVLLNHYQREYYVTPDGAARVTLDFAQAAYDQRLAPRVNVSRRSPLADTLVIEVKAAPDQATQLADMMARFPIPYSRNSKYANGILAALG
jgi:hypothetical protein